MPPSSELKNWLYASPTKEEIKGDETEGFFLGIETVREKLNFLEEKFLAQVGYSNFRHIVFYDIHKNLYASGSLEVSIKFESGETKNLVGAATFNVADYHPNSHYAATLKSLCINNAMLEYPQFGGLLNKGLVKNDKPVPVKIDPIVARWKTLVESSVTKKQLNGYMNDKDFPAELLPLVKEKMKKLK